MAKFNPLDLPEVWQLVSRYLNDGDISRCLSVCRSWHRLLLSYIWDQVLIESTSKYGQSRGPPMNSLQCHRNMIRKLEIESDELDSYDMKFPRLETLVVKEELPLSSKIGGGLLYLITLNRTISSLHLHGLGRRFRADLFGAIASLPCLGTLKIYSAVITCDDDAFAFWNSCSKLENIHLFDVKFPDENASIGDLTLPLVRLLELRRVMFYNTDRENSIARRIDPLDLLLRCPNLKEFRWSSHSNNPAHTMLEEFARYTQYSWPFLEMLSIGTGVDDQCLCPIISRSKEITKLEVISSTVKSPTICALERHFSTLVEVRFERCSGLESLALQKILETCSNLHVFVGGTILAKDIVDNKHWTCLSLRTLHVNFKFENNDYNLQELLFERLAMLKQLEDLAIANNNASSTTYLDSCLDFRIDSGLEKLEELKNMRCVNLGKSWQNLGIGEVQWILNNWKRLLAIYGVLNTENNINSELILNLRLNSIITG